MIDAMNAKPCLFTIGHSDHEIGDFINLLAGHGVNVVADVRSQPYSRFHPQFNREALAASLKQSKMQYAFLGRELGARREEKESYKDGQARYDLISRTAVFHEGLARIRSRLGSHRIALMCAEKDPITCHRSILICRHMRSQNLEIKHIREDGAIETNEQAEARLLETVGLPAMHLFQDKSELIEQAYEMQGERIAYREAEDSSVAAGGIG